MATRADFPTDCRSIAQATLDLMERMGTQPTPKAYETLFAYACDRPAGLREDVDALVNADGRIDSFDLDQIHFKYFRSANGEWERQEKSAVALEGQITSMVARVDSRIETGRKFGHRLQSASSNIKSASSGAQVKEIVEVLIEDNTKALKETEQFNRELSVSRELFVSTRNDIAEARDEGLRDPLTGLYGRRYFETTLSDSLRNAITNGQQLLLCLADVDNLSAVNRRFGPATGDSVVRVLGRLVAAHLSEGHFAARVEGSVFAMIIPNVIPSEGHALIEKVRASFENKRLVIRETRQEIGCITASFGLSFLRGGDQPTDLYNRARKLCVDVKKRGRNGILSDMNTLF